MVFRKPERRRSIREQPAQTQFREEMASSIDPREDKPAEPRKVGRPLKYQHILEALEDDGLYTAACIVAFAEKQGFLASFAEDGVDVKRVKLRMRISLNRTKSRFVLPLEGDGQVTRKGQAPKPAWFGWRWKATIHAKAKDAKGEKNDGPKRNHDHHLESAR